MLKALVRAVVAVLFVKYRNRGVFAQAIHGQSILRDEQEQQYSGRLDALENGGFHVFEYLQNQPSSRL